MKTAMQKVVDKLNAIGFTNVDEFFKEFLETEKQQIIEAYSDGMEYGFNKFGEDAKQYYDSTFNNQQI